MRFSRALLVVAILAVLALVVVPSHAAARNEYQEVILDAGKRTVVEMKRYIISLKENANKKTLDDLINKVTDVGGKVLNRFSVIPAISVEIPANVVTSFSSISGVDYIEEDKPVQAYGGVGI
ncbi:hypothetical protein SpCBS45565_g07636 [Spizellomyces sp. 'palustris']|nr:hypothetical protein SpCBS45565_g07636 [Spizellomyces sp. 'palustris']